MRLIATANPARSLPRFLVFIASLFISGFSIAQSENDAEDYLTLEVSGGLGYAQSFDYNLFNNNVPYRVKGGLGYQLALHYYLNYNFSIGLKADGMYEIISEYPDDVLGFFIDENMHLSTINIGLEGRYVYGLKRYQPFFGFGVKYVYGDLNFTESGYINGFRGAAINGVGGIGYLIRNDIMISIEALAQSGWAQWRELPSNDSINQKINPGMFSILISASYFFDAN